MTKYRLIFQGEPDDELYDSYDEADEAGLFACSCARIGTEILYLSNPDYYDYDYDENEEYEFSIEEID